MVILGLETSCDETAAAVVRDGRGVLSSVIASQHDLHAEYAGVVPEIASRAHVEAIVPVVRRACADAGIGLAGIDAVAVGHRPGLVGSLLVGISAAKALAWSLEKPLVGVDHVHAHLYAGLLQRDEVTKRPRDGVRGGGSGGETERERDEVKDSSGAESADVSARTSSHRLSVSSPLFPALGLVVSGGHTSLYVVRSPIELTRIGATIDDALGEAFDKAATILGLAHPGGPNLDRLASEAGADERAHSFPIARLSRESLDMSFSGLKTSLLYTVRGKPGRGEHGPQGYEREAAELTATERRDLAASFQRAAVEAVMLKLRRALDRFEELAGAPCRAVLTGGGVTANSRLRRELRALGEEQGLPVVIPAPGLCVDNAAMIAGLAFELLGAGRAADLTLAPVPTTAC